MRAGPISSKSWHGEGNGALPAVGRDRELAEIALPFAEAFTPTVISTDLTPSMLAAARGFIQSKATTGNVRFLASDVEALPFRDSTYGVVTCRLAAHHFPAILPALKEVARVLRPGGSLLVEDILGHEDRELAAFILEIEKRRDPSHVRALTHREWEAFLKAAGMTVIDESTLSKSRPWEEWTARMRMAPEAKADLERFVLDAPARCREAFVAVEATLTELLSAAGFFVEIRRRPAGEMLFELIGDDVVPLRLACWASC